MSRQTLSFSKSYEHPLSYRYQNRLNVLIFRTPDPLPSMLVYTLARCQPSPSLLLFLPPFLLPLSPRYTKLGFAGNTEPQFIMPSCELHGKVEDAISSACKLQFPYAKLVIQVFRYSEQPVVNQCWGTFVELMTASMFACTHTQHTHAHTTHARMHARTHMHTHALIYTHVATNPLVNT